MLISAPCELAEDFLFFTLGSSCHYVIGAQKLSGIDLCCSAQLDSYFERLKQFNKNPEQLDNIYITHAHADRVGALPYLKKQYPNVRLIGSVQLQKHLGQPEFLQKIYESDCALRDSFQLDSSDRLEAEQFVELLSLDSVAHDGDTFETDTHMTLRSIKFSGHSDHSVAYMVDPEQCLVCDEVCGYFDWHKGHIPAPDYSFQETQNSLEKIKNLPLQGLALLSQGVLTGSLVQKYLSSAIGCFEELKAELREAQSEEMSEKEILDNVESSLYRKDSLDPISRHNRRLTFESIQDQIREILNVN